MQRIADSGLRFVALGDSYTIGTSVPAAERWPNRLVARLDGRLQLKANLAVNGFTSRDVYAQQLPQWRRLDAEFTSLLIGVNDVIQGVSGVAFERQVASILDELLQRLPPRRILTVSTPDYTVTPEGGSYGDPATRRAAIVALNEVVRKTAESRAVAFVEIFDLSSRAESDRSLVASDGLHPSGRQYELWVDRIGPVVEALLRG